MVEREVSALKQEVTDLKESYHEDILDIKKTLSDILAQTRKTNGRVNKLEAREEMCPAKQAYQLNNKNAKNSNTIAIISAGIAVLAVLVTIIR